MAEVHVVTIPDKKGKKSFDKETWKREKDAQTATLKALIEDGVKTFSQSENWQEYLDFCAGFHSYSATNCALIFMQKSDATQVASFKFWNEKGRFVRKGEKAIRIFAQRFGKQEIEREDGETEENEYTTFAAVPVFDVSQTVGDPLPEVAHVLDFSVDGYDKIMEKLREISPFPIVFADLYAGLKGQCDFVQKQITVRCGLPEAQAIKTTAHEIAHALLHDKSGENVLFDLMGLLYPDGRDSVKAKKSARNPKPTTPTENPRVEMANPTTPTENPRTEMANPTTPTENPRTEMANPTTTTENTRVEMANPTTEVKSDEIPVDRSAREIEAESVAYIVCRHLGIDSADYTFGYLTNWSGGTDFKLAKETMTRIQKAAQHIIGKLDSGEKTAKAA
jgi:hypothetical protein